MEAKQKFASHKKKKKQIPEKKKKVAKQNNAFLEKGEAFA